MGGKKKEYEVGYGKPPQNHQWKKGQSGNPAGKKGKVPAAKPLVQYLNDQLNQQVEVTIGGKKEKMALSEALAKKLFHQLMTAPTKEVLEALAKLKALGLLDLQQMQYVEPEDDGCHISEEDRRLLEIIEKEVEGWPEEGAS